MISEVIEVEKTSNYLEREKKWGVSLRSVKPYGKHDCTRGHIYATAHFHKNIDKAFAMAWKDFYSQKDYIDRDDRRIESRQTEIVKVGI